MRDLGVDLPGMAGPILAPGLGAQGATAADVRSVFSGALPQVLASSSATATDPTSTEPTVLAP